MDTLWLTVGLVVGLAIGGTLAWALLRGKAQAAEARYQEIKRTQQETQDRLQAATEERLQDYRRAQEETLGRLHTAADLRVEEYKRGQEEWQRRLQVTDETHQLELRRQQEEAAQQLQATVNAHREEQRRIQEDLDRKIQDTFTAIASKALANSNEAFLQLAQQSLQSHLAQAQGDLELRKQAVDGLVKPLADELKRMEQERQTAYGGLTQVTESLVKGQGALATETRGLVQVLRAPQVGGRWGELTLRRVVELAGMVAHCDFEEQKTFQGELRDKRPDMVINFPDAGRIAVDAKAPLDAYLQAVDAKEQEVKDAALKNHARVVRDRARELGSKAYWQALGYSPEFVVLFLPGDPFLSAALQENPQLFEEALSNKVILATPSTLIALLLSAAYGWRGRQAEENAQRISALGREMYERIATWAGHLDRVGDSLEKAVKAYNDSVGSLESRVLVSARRFKELGAGTERELPEVAQVDVGVRKVELANPEGQG